MKIAVHQPNFLPWLGYFLKMSVSDVFVFHDNVEMTKSGPIRRVRISANHTYDHVQWLTIPLIKHSDYTKIRDLRISFETDWKSKHLATIAAAYRKSPYFEEYYPVIVQWYDSVNNFDLLSEMNIHFIKKIMELLKIQKELHLSSLLPVSGKSSQYNLSILKYLGGTKYICGIGSDNYQENTLFEEQGIELYRYNSLSLLEANPYNQFSSSHSMGLSCIDALLNIGVEGIRDIINLK